MTALFVALRHSFPEGDPRPAHVDLMLQRENQLLTWRIASMPTVPGSIAAEQIAPHRIAYLDYEGLLTGNRGEVVRLDRGRLIWRMLNDERIVCDMAGAVLCCELAGQRQTDQTWEFTLGLRTTDSR